MYPRYATGSVVRKPETTAETLKEGDKSFFSTVEVLQIQELSSLKVFRFWGLDEADLMSKRLPPKKKDRNQYVHPNPRRLYCIMPAEEAAKRPKEEFTELEIIGNVSRLSSSLWQMTSLTSLYLNNNSLTSIPGEISLLVNLAHLNVSCNKLRTLPPEIGDMQSLRELLLNHNKIVTLPTQLGKLFKLCKLELSGNPLGGRIMEIINRPSCRTEDILSYLIDHLPVELNDLVRDLNLSKNKVEILASRLQQRNLLEENVRVTSFHTRHLLFESFFKKEESIVFCCDIDGLLKELRIAHEPNEWRLFIDALKLSFKAVLLNNGNELPSIPVAHAVYMKETYHNLKQLLEMINYSKYGWQICADLKRDWPQRASFKPGEMNVKHPLLAEPHKIIIPPLHIKLGLVKNLAKAMDKNGPAFKYLHEKFPRLSVAKIKEGVFVGTQIKQLFRDSNFETSSK
ncbi:CCR4-NOT transcription complex subunit 6-like [Araneus ventricosus]|uniref:CCR4-NOT transcription complex subunit 6-like n=1 Tax=Araneus ventricosus TaxID=182803 RepID=A0A4Y2FQH3_ARAVE|nr:CCR4-NOT transcription complex subunit 6-like [Araneus ventricosus]